MSQPLYKSRRQNRIIITSFAARLAETWINFDVRRLLRNYAVSLQVKICSIDNTIYLELDVTCIRNKKIAARRDCSPSIPHFGIEKMYFFSVENNIYLLKIIKNDFFSHILTVAIVSPPATMLQVATAFFHSWLTRPIATCFFDNTGKRGSYLETVYSYLLTVPPTSVDAERAFSAVAISTTKLRSQLSDNSVNTLCFLSFFVFEISLNVTKPLEVQTVVQTILSLFSGLILLVN